MLLTGRIDGALRYGEPIPASFSLKAGSNSHSFGADVFRSLGILLKSIREGDPEGYLRAQHQALIKMGVGRELIEALLSFKEKVELSIRFGAGDRSIAMDLMRTLEELKRNGAEVETSAEERVISAGAYVWMTGTRRFVQPDSKFLWHTRTPIPGYVTQADKEEDLQLMVPFFYQATEPLRSQFLAAIAQDDKGSHEITTTGNVLVRAGLAEYK